MCKRSDFKMAALGAIAALAVSLPVAAQNATSTEPHVAAGAADWSQVSDALAKAQAGLEKAQDAFAQLDVRVDLSGLQLPDLSGLQMPDLSGLSALSSLSSLSSLAYLNFDGAEAARQAASSGKAYAAGGAYSAGNAYSDAAHAYSESASAYASTTDDEKQARSDREEELYNDGTDAIDDAKWEQAIEKFDQVIDMHGKHADGAMYFKAYAENKRGQRAEALTLIAQLKKDYPNSKWVKEASALQIEVQQASGNTPSPDAQSDCELKLYAVNALQQADSQRAIPVLEKLLQGDSACSKLSNQALFVLAQMNSSEAHQVIARIATGQSNPALQKKAIQDLGLFSGQSGRDTLLQIYNSSADVSIKKDVLNAFMLSGARDQILTAAKGEKNPELRGEAIRQMGLMGAREDIWQLYQTEQDVQVKKQILQAMWLAGDHERVGQLAVNEKDHTLRLQAINDLGLMGKSSGPALKQIYAQDSDNEVKRKVINALFLAGDSRDLVELARAEKDPTLKKAIVSQLSLMGDKDATDYLMEILNK